jgi:hypothetical protein
MSRDDIRLIAVSAFGIFFLAVWLFEAPAHCEEAVTEGVDTDGAVAVSEGDRAPFDGILFPTELAIQMGFRIETLQTRLRLDIDREQRICQAQIEFQDQRLSLETGRRDFQINLLQQRVDDQAAIIARPTPWYQRWGFAFGMGIFTSSLLVAGGVALLLSVM